MHTPDLTGKRAPKNTPAALPPWALPPWVDRCPWRSSSHVVSWLKQAGFKPGAAPVSVRLAEVDADYYWCRLHVYQGGSLLAAWKVARDKRRKLHCPHFASFNLPAATALRLMDAVAGTLAKTFKASSHAQRFCLFEQALEAALNDAAGCVVDEDRLYAKLQAPTRDGGLLAAVSQGEEKRRPADARHADPREAPRGARGVHGELPPGVAARRE
jgi:hypothetical protein